MLGGYRIKGVVIVAAAAICFSAGCSKKQTPATSRQANCSCPTTMKNCTCDHCTGKSQVCPCKLAKPATAGKRDPVCGMRENLTMTSTFEGKDFAFCSEKCKTKFDANPAEYRWGYCSCKETMPGCGCAHCKKNSEPCDCEEEKK